MDLYAQKNLRLTHVEFVDGKSIGHQERLNQVTRVKYVVVFTP